MWWDGSITISGGLFLNRGMLISSIWDFWEDDFYLLGINTVGW